ncbi:MAG: hypothetical protein M5U12_12755 [Verrucomicrobia bacterium]|nr:hypothetical protein [Verrucomicrobiota bacterium]
MASNPALLCGGWSTQDLLDPEWARHPRRFYRARGSSGIEIYLQGHGRGYLCDREHHGRSGRLVANPRLGRTDDGDGRMGRSGDHRAATGVPGACYGPARDWVHDPYSPMSSLGAAFQILDMAQVNKLGLRPATLEDIGVRGGKIGEVQRDFRPAHALSLGPALPGDLPYPPPKPEVGPDQRAYLERNARQHSTGRAEFDMTQATTQFFRLRKLD